MRHRKKVKKLGRTTSHRKALLKNLASALIEHHQIRTTFTKAKAAQSYIEKLITFGKNDTVHSRRQAFKFLQNRDLVKRLFDEIASTFKERNGGYTRVIKLGKRRGDNAEMAILQLVGFEQLVIDETEPKKKKQKKSKTTEKEKAPAKKETAVEKPAAIETKGEKPSETGADKAAGKPAKKPKKTEASQKEDKTAKAETPAEQTEKVEKSSPSKSKEPDAETGNKNSEEDGKKGD